MVVGWSQLPLLPAVPAYRPDQFPDGPHANLSGFTSSASCYGKKGFSLQRW